MGRRAHLLPCKFTQEEPTPVAPVRLQGRMTPNGYEPENRAWRPFLTYPTKRTRADGSQRWLHKFGRRGKWNFCLTTGTLMPANQERR